MKKGFEFSLMVVGESGLGKSTLVNIFFYTGDFSVFVFYIVSVGQSIQYFIFTM